MERNPYFWQVDQAGQPAPLHRPAQLQHLAGRRVPDARRDLRPPGHPGAPHRHPAEQADALAEHAEGRLPPGRAHRLRRAAGSDLPEHHAQGPEDAGDVRQQGVPAGALDGHQPQGDHRHRLSRPVASPGRRARARAIPGTTRSSSRQFTEHDPKQGERDPRQARLHQEGRARASACVPTGRRCSSPSTSSRRSIPTPWTRSSW